MSLPYRQIHLDFHTSPYICDVGKDFDRDQWVKTLVDAHVNHINLFAKDHHGYFFYPSVCGPMHPGLFDKTLSLLDEQVSACKEHGISVGIYTCVAWNEYAANCHPEWQQVDMQGVLGANPPFAADYYKWQNLCLNHPDYLALIKRELAEEADKN